MFCMWFICDQKNLTKSFLFSQSAFERLSFDAEWFQEDACIKRLFILTYFPFDRSVELVILCFEFSIISIIFTPSLNIHFQFDRQKNKVFLKRVIVPEITENCLDIGSKLNIFGRQVIVKACEDDYTKEKLSRQRQKYAGIFPKKRLSFNEKKICYICNFFSTDHLDWFPLNICRN